MPVWLKCKNCEKEFYTAKSDYRVGTSEECQNCGGILNKICKNLQRVLEENMLVEVKLNSEQGDRRARCMVEDITEDNIELVVRDGHIPSDISSREDGVRVGFSRNKPMAGRYYFQSSVEVVSGGENGSKLILSSPEYALRQQERRAPRYPLDADVKYRLVENKADFDEIKSRGGSKERQTEDVLESEGKAVDVSLSGILVADDPERISGIDEDQKVSLNIETEEEEIELTGEIARVDELEEEEKVGLGIKFNDVSSEEEIMLQKIQMEKF